MTLQTVSSENVSLHSGAFTVYPEVEATPGVGHIFAIEARPRGVVINSHFFIVVATIKRGTSRIEVPLSAKYYPKGVPLYFFVPVPPSGSGATTQIEIKVAARRRQRGTKVDISPVRFLLSYDPIEDLPLAVGAI